MEDKKMVLVLSVLEGQHFPRKQNYQLTVEARFDGEAITTNAIDHVASPNFNTELGWEVDRRGLHVLKMQKAPVKVLCFAQDKTGAKESVGYIILDLTMAKQPTMKPKWFPILNSKYQTKPELLLTLGLEDDVQPEKQHNLKAEELKKAQPSESSEFSNLVPIMVDDGDYYQIGPTDKCTDFFAFSVTIGFASNLDKLVSPTTPLPRDQGGFFFFYSLIGNEIFTDPFSNLELADFAAERATVRFRSSLAALRVFFRRQSKIKVHLCLGDQSLGRANVSLLDLIPAWLESIEDPRIIEDAYEMQTCRQSQMSDFLDTEKPTVAIVLSLTKDSVLSDDHPSREISPPSARRNLQYPQTPPQRLEKESSEEKGNNECIELPVTPKSDRVLKIPTDIDDEVGGASSETLMTYRFSIDLRTVKNILVELPFNCYLRYSYPALGTSTPIVTHPTVDARQGTSAILQNSFTAFQFITKARQLEAVFRKNPLKIEVLQRDLSSCRDVVVGFSIFHLGQLLDAEMMMIVDKIGKNVSSRSVLSTLPVISKETGLKIAEMQLFTTLDDYGPGESDDVDGASNNNVQSQVEEAESRVRPTPQDTWEDRLSKQAAVEIERWKEAQEATFLKQLKGEETKRMEAIAREWTARETERELLVQKKLAEYEKLEDKLSKGLAKIEEREQKLALREIENERIKNECQLEYERLMQELKDSARRYKEECSHKIELEKSKLKANQDQCAKLQRHINELEKNLEVREAQHQAYQDQKTLPLIRLESELNLLKIEKVELDRKVQALTKSKVHYKQQYARCLSELSRLKRAMQSEAQAQLHQQKQDLEQMRSQLMTSSINQRINGRSNSALLDELSSEAIKNNRRSKQDVHAERTSRNGSSGRGRRHMTKLQESELAHLMDERETLLRTGCYAPEDPIILQLDEEIKRMISDIG